jgi:hypothetical protein
VAQQLPGVCNVDKALLSISSGHFQSVTICNALVPSSERRFFKTRQ